MSQLYFLAAFAQVLDYLLDAKLVDNAQAFPRDLEFDELSLVLQPKSLGMEVG